MTDWCLLNFQWRIFHAFSRHILNTVVRFLGIGLYQDKRHKLCIAKGRLINPSEIYFHGSLSYRVAFTLYQASFLTFPFWQSVGRYLYIPHGTMDAQLMQYIMCFFLTGVVQGWPYIYILVIYTEMLILIHQKTFYHNRVLCYHYTEMNQS